MGWLHTILDPVVCESEYVGPGLLFHFTAVFFREPCSPAHFTNTRQSHSQKSLCEKWIMSWTRLYLLELSQLLLFDLIEARTSLLGFLNQPISLLEDLSALCYGRELTFLHLLSDGLCATSSFLTLLLLLLLLLDDRLLLHPEWRKVGGGGKTNINKNGNKWMLGLFSTQLIESSRCRLLKDRFTQNKSWATSVVLENGTF